MNVTSPIAEALSQVNYTYDNVNQLMSATKTVQSNSNESFTYDNLGNRLKKNNQSTNNVYDNNNRIVSDDVYNYTHDDNGNMIKKVKRSTGYTTKYFWDFENKLQFIKEYNLETDASPVKTHTFLYDVYGRRIVKDSDGVVHKYVYDNEDILFEFDNNDNLVSQFTHGPGIDEPVEIIQNNQNYYYHVDGLGSITGISSTNGEIVQSYAYSSFGETKIYDQSGTLIDPTQMQVKSPYGYTSREWDFETEKYQYRSRDYDPRTGRFISSDPIHFNGGDSNLYRYVKNASTVSTDPYGLDTYGYGVGFGASWMHHSVSFSFQYVFDDNSCSGFAFSSGYGVGGSYGYSIGGTGQASYSSGNVSDLAGPGGQVGIGAFNGFGGQNSVTVGNGTTGYTSELGYGIGASYNNQVTATKLFGVSCGCK